MPPQEAEALRRDAEFLLVFEDHPGIALRIYRGFCRKLLESPLSTSDLSGVAGAYLELHRRLVPAEAGADPSLRSLDRRVRERLGRFGGADVVDRLAEEMEKDPGKTRAALARAAEALSGLGYGPRHPLEEGALSSYRDQVGRWVDGWDPRSVDPARLGADLDLLGRLAEPVPAGALDGLLAGFADRLASACSDAHPLPERSEALARLNPCLRVIRGSKGFRRAAAAIDEDLRGRFRGAPLRLARDELELDLPAGTPGAVAAAGAVLVDIEWLETASGRWRALTVDRGGEGETRFLFPAGAWTRLLYRLEGAAGAFGAASVVLMPRSGGARAEGDRWRPPLPRSWLPGRICLYLEEQDTAVALEAIPWTGAVLLSRLGRSLRALGTLAPPETASLRDDLDRLAAASNLPARLGHLAPDASLAEEASRLEESAGEMGGEDLSPAAVLGLRGGHPRPPPLRPRGRGGAPGRATRLPGDAAPRPAPLRSSRRPAPPRLGVPGAPR